MPRPAPPAPTSLPHTWRVTIDHGSRGADAKRIRVEQCTPGEDARAIAIFHAQAISALRQSERKTGQTPTFADYVERMAEFQIAVVPRFSATTPDRAPGLAFKTASTTLFASDIATVEGRRSPLSWDQIAKAGFDCDLERDLPLLQRLAERGSDAIRAAGKDEILPVVEDKREVIGAGYGHAITDQEKRENGRLIADAIANGYVRQFVTTGDRSAGRFFDVTDMIGLKWDDASKRLLEDPAAASKVFAYHDTSEDRRRRLYTKHSNSEARTFRTVRRRHYGSLAQAIRQVQGYALLNDPLDPTKAETRGQRRAFFTAGGGGDNDGQNARRYTHQALENAGLAILAKARGLPPGSERMVFAARHGRITFDQALAAARMAGCDLPRGIARGIGGKDGLTEAQEWAMQELRTRVEAGVRPLPSTMGLGEVLSDAGFANRKPGEGHLRLLTERGLPETIAWIAATRFVHLARDGYKVERAEAGAPTIAKRPQNWLPIDIDGFVPPPKEKLHLNADWKERYPDGIDVAARPDEFVRWWSEAFLPRQFKGVYTYWQHSSSAGWETEFKADQKPSHYTFTGRMPKASLHLYVPLEGYHDIKVVGAWVTAAAKSKLADLVDQGILEVEKGADPLKAIHLDTIVWNHPVQPIYCKAPRIEDVCGNPEPDPLGRRDGEIEGAPAVLVPACVSRASLDKIAAMDAKANARLDAHGFCIGSSYRPRTMDADAVRKAVSGKWEPGAVKEPIEAMILSARTDPMSRDGQRIGFFKQTFRSMMFWLEAAYLKDPSRFTDRDEHSILAEECASDMQDILRGVYQDEVGYEIVFDTRDEERYLDAEMTDLRKSANWAIKKVLENIGKPDKKAEMLARFGVVPTVPVEAVAPTEPTVDSSAEIDRDAAAARVLASALSARVMEAPSL